MIKEVTEVVEAYKKARDLLEKGWIQGALAKDSEGHRVEVVDPNAVCFCSIGALRKVTGLGNSHLDTTFGFYSNVVAYLCVELRDTHTSVVKWNDDQYRTKEEVLQTFDKIITKLESQV